MPIESRIKFKLCVLMYRFHGIAPLHQLACTYANCATHVLTVDYAANQEATSVGYSSNHGLVSDLLTKLSPSQRHLPGTHSQLTFVIVVARQHSRNISRLSCFMELLICIIIYYAALLPRRGPHIASHSVCPSVCPSVRPSRYHYRASRGAT